MRRMITGQQIKTVEDVGEYIEFSDIQTTIGNKLCVDGEIESNTRVVAPEIWQGSNWFVKGMQAPGLFLTDDEIAQLVDGRYINGEYLGFKNPIFFPGNLVDGNYYGALIGINPVYANTSICYYVINGTTKEISILTPESRQYDVSNLRYVNGKVFPIYPSDTGTYTLKCVNGTLTWVNG